MRLTLDGLREALDGMGVKVSISTLHRIEDNASKPTKQLFGPLARALGCRQKDLRSG